MTTCTTTCSGSCVVVCGGSCTDLCADGCYNTCSIACADSCTGSCAGGCSTACTTTCLGSCLESCVQTCAGSCSDVCSTECTVNCDAECVQTCSGGCKEGCLGSCSGTCIDNCVAACAVDCSGTCSSSCSEGCFDGCMETCIDNCVEACAINCSDTCSGSSTTTNPGDGTLELGDTGSEVTVLQQDLVYIGYSLSVTGTYDAATESAVRVFQILTGIGVDGIVGPETRNKLAEVVSNKNNGWLSRGMKGSDILHLQNNLNTLGYNCGTADGEFGINTYNAVRSFQAAKGLTQDGIVGPATMSAINAALNAPAGIITIHERTSSSITLNIIRGIGKRIKYYQAANYEYTKQEIPITDQEANTGKKLFENLVPNTAYIFELINSQGTIEFKTGTTTLHQGTVSLSLVAIDVGYSNITWKIEAADNKTLEAYESTITPTGSVSYTLLDSMTIHGITCTYSISALNPDTFYIAIIKDGDNPIASDLEKTLMLDETQAENGGHNELIDKLNFLINDGDLTLGNGEIWSIFSGIFQSGIELWNKNYGNIRIDKLGKVIKVTETVGGTARVIGRYTLDQAEEFPQYLKYFSSRANYLDSIKSTLGAALSLIGIAIDVREGIKAEIEEANAENRAVRWYDIAVSIVYDIAIGVVGAVIGTFVGAYFGSLVLTPGLGTLIGSLTGGLAGYIWSVFTDNARDQIVDMITALFENADQQVITGNAWS